MHYRLPSMSGVAAARKQFWGKKSAQWYYASPSGVTAGCHWLFIAYFDGETRVIGQYLGMVSFQLEFSWKGSACLNGDGVSANGAFYPFSL